MPKTPNGRYRWREIAGYTWTFGRLDRWQWRPVAVDTDRHSFWGIQVHGWHLGIAR